MVDSNALRKIEETERERKRESEGERDEERLTGNNSAHAHIQGRELFTKCTVYNMLTRQSDSTKAPEVCIALAT